MRIAIIFALVTALVAPVSDAELLTPCGYTVSQLESALLGDLKPLAKEFIEAEQETGVNAVFLASVAALESGWGSSHRAREYNNLFGWGNHRFASQEVCIEVVSHSLAENYLSPDGRYFKGYTVEDVSYYYNNTAHWREQVRAIMGDISRRASDGTKVEKTAALPPLWRTVCPQ